jgi:DnaJ-class molecular chaperone
MIDYSNLSSISPLYVFCSNNHDDVREEWERIKLSYEILSDKRARRRYDRHEVIADPGAAMRRAAVGAVGNGVAGVGKGLFNIGAFAVQQMMDKKDEK